MRRNTQPTVIDHVVDDRHPMQVLEPKELDDFLAAGWRLLGNTLTRHNISVWAGALCGSIPLRIDLDRFFPSKSQRKMYRKNADLILKTGKIALDDEIYELFDLHSERLSERRPGHLHSFITPNSDAMPTTGLCLRLYEGNRLVACSFIHLGEQTVSGTYCIFDPACYSRSLGIYTMLLELDLSRSLGKKYYYHGYYLDVPSQFDYKLGFEGLEEMNWESGLWTPISRRPDKRHSNPA